MISLKPYNTFGIDVKASSFIEINNLKEGTLLFQQQDFSTKKHLILGGGSNILLTQDFNGTVIKNSILGIELVDENENDVWLKVGAGENWHQFVMHCLNKEYYGIENLSLIPGNVGASPMQNIGAYGVEVKDFIDQVLAINIATGELKSFSNSECEFDYRSSIFKTHQKGKYFIAYVIYKLSKTPAIKVEYGAIQQQLSSMNINTETAKPSDVSKAVIAIRQSKLPDPSKIGNAGSFFKNPVVSVSKKNALVKKFPDIPFYPVTEEQFKLAAGWLIEKSGWKGYREGDFGVHRKQALVLVNYNNASGEEIFQLSEKILKAVYNEFGVELEREVNIIRE